MSFELRASKSPTRLADFMGLYPALPIRIPKPMLRNPSLLSGKLFQALIKIYVRLVIAQSIQLSNIILVNLRPLTRLSGYELFRKPTNIRPTASIPTQYSMPAKADTQHQIGNWWS